MIRGVKMVIAGVLVTELSGSFLSKKKNILPYQSD